MSKRPTQRSSGGSWVIAVIVLAVIAVAAVFLVRRAMQPTPKAAAPAPAESAPAPASTAPAIAHPIEQSQATPAVASTAPLPALGESDASVLDGLAGLAGGDELRALLIPTQVIPRIVATVDALPRSGIGNQILPVHGAKGVLQTTESGGQSVIGDANAARYAPYMAALKDIDSAALVGWYKHEYPLFQQAYVELGYPKGYFNDRLVAVIDHLLAAPTPSQPPALTRSKTAYVFVDPALEGLSVGQKAMIRIGPANEAAVKAKLREIRGLLVHAVPAAGTTVAPASSGSTH